MEFSGGLPSAAREDHASKSSVRATRVAPWETPWTDKNKSGSIPLDHKYRPRNSRSKPASLPSPSRPDLIFDDEEHNFLLRERERERGQRRVRQQRYRRQTSLNLLEAYSINRTLDEQQHRAMAEISELRRERAELRAANKALRADLQHARSSLDRAHDEETKRLAELTEQVARLSDALTTQVSLLVGQKKRCFHLERELKKCHAALADAGTAVGEEADERDGGYRESSSSPTATAAVEGNVTSSSGSGSGRADSSGYSSSLGSTDGSHTASSESLLTKPTESPSRAQTVSPSSAGSAVGSKDGPCTSIPLVPDEIDAAKTSLKRTMSRWLEGMHSACSLEVRRTLVLPWVLHKLFYLSSELVDERHEELRRDYNVQALGREGSEEGTFLEHLRQNHLDLFPLRGDSQKTIVDNLMMAVSRSMVDSEGWNQSLKDPVAVQTILAASGLDKIVEEYLNMTVLCSLQEPPVIFTFDLGEVERFDPEKHSEPLDGEPVGDWCIVVFPAFVVTVGDGESDEWEEHVVGKRLILNHKKE